MRYNAQLVVNAGQVVLAPEITTESPDFGHLEPMVRARQRELHTIGLGDPEVVLADAGYRHQRQIEHIASDGMTVLVPPDGGLRKGARPGWTGGFYDVMRRLLATPEGRALYLQRQITIEPVFDQIKFNRAIKRFQRRGRSACRSEWRLIAASHNLLKLHIHQLAAAALSGARGALSAPRRRLPALIRSALNTPTRADHENPPRPFPTASIRAVVAGRLTDAGRSRHADSQFRYADRVRGALATCGSASNCTTRRVLWTL